jgi:hypothetical protein
MEENEDKTSLLAKAGKVPEDKARLYQNGMGKKEATLRLKELIKNNGSKPLAIKNIEGEEARLSGTSIGKLVSAKAVKKSIDNGFTKEQQVAAASDIDNLFKNSLNMLSHPDKNGYSDVTIHRFAASLFENNAAYITLKEVSEYGKRIYTIELVELGKLEGILKKSIAQKSPAPFPASSSPVR